VWRHQDDFSARKIAFMPRSGFSESLPDLSKIGPIPSEPVLTLPDVVVPDWSERDAAIAFLSSPPPRRNSSSPIHVHTRKTLDRKKLFLNAPLRYRRISSGFSHNRKHPVYHVRRPHLGIDYAAPMGTAVHTVGQGTVTFVGWSKGFGRCVHIRHPHGYTTYYGHLSRYANGIGVGKRIKRGSVIGYVGRSGIATGPHLDFRLSHRGRFINPLSLGKIKKPV
jgi:murein DD-endopeptidase MepM/ murein hydrolase activator NlpD